MILIRLVIVLLSFISLCGCLSQPELYKESRLLMGTTVEVTLEGKRDESQKVAGELYKVLEKLEAKFSLYNPESEICAVNKKANQKRVKVSDEFFELLEKSLIWSELTSGAFDVSVGPLVKLWGFKEHRPVFPGEEELKRVLLLCGYTKIRLFPETREVSFSQTGMEIDMGAVAKGYIVGEGIRFLKRNGVSAGLINAGGDLYGLGSPRGQEGWRAGIQHPRHKGKVLARLNICDKAVVTSGDYENFFIHQGKYLSHIFDPRTGRPSESGVISATVISGDIAEADALATALVVMGRDRGLELIEHLPGVEAMVVYMVEGKLKASVSSGLNGKIRIDL